ncbi:PIG-L family deacetylase [candidate division KSB1 bacterium]|nr:PIG-L family deacetylase [candidate division KSB1 bacterium]
MKILYIYPHPDDESFGPAHVMSLQRRQGHEVYLLTLTKGGATKQRFRLNLTVDEMGEVRYKEMLNVAKILDLSDMTVLDLPDSGLKEMDPREIERVIKNHIGKIQPQVILTYAVHGISGFHDHLVSHAVVKRVFVELRDNGATYLKRLAFVTLREEIASNSPHFHLNGSKPNEIDCVVHVEQHDMERFQRALDCYETFQETIDKSGVRDMMTTEAVFEIYQEQHDPPLTDLCQGLTL